MGIVDEVNQENKEVTWKELSPHIGNVGRSTIQNYIDQGMPYIHGKPHKYVISECVAWYNENRPKYRKTYNH